MAESITPPVRLPNNPVAREYQATFRGDSRIARWYEFHAGELLELIKDPRAERQISTNLQAAVRLKYGLPADTRLPPIGWVTGNPAVVALTGGQFAIPTMVFTDDEAYALRHIFPPNAIALTSSIPIEFASLGTIPSYKAQPSRIAMFPYPTDQLPVTYQELTQHEFAHAVDPNRNLRPNDLPLTELVALIGSFSDPENRHVSLVLHPPFIAPYLMRELQSQGKKVTVEEFQKMVNLVVGLVYHMTHGRIHVPNDEITRRLMRCRSMDELRQSWPEIFEQEYDEVRIVIREES